MLKNVIAMLVLTGTQHSYALSMEPIDIGQVKVSGEIGRRIEMTVQKNILAIDTDKDFLKPFVDRSVETEGYYVAIGKHLDAMARLTYYSNNEELNALKEHVVNTMISTQESNGYIGVYRPENLRVSTCYDLHEMSYMIIGFTSDYKYCGQQGSLEAAKKLADYVISILEDPKRKPFCFGGLSDKFPFLGFEEALIGLYQQTGEERYRDFCVEYRNLYNLPKEIVVGRWGSIEGQSYTDMCPANAQLILYKSDPDARLLKRSHRIVDFLTKEDGMLIPGTCSYQECWTTDQRGFYKTAETCATTYMLKMLHGLMQLEGKSLYGDIIERSIYNGLFAALSPDGREIRYYTAFEGPRAYFTWGDKLIDNYCCPGNFRRSIADLPEMVYYRSDKGVAVNLYTESTADIKLNNNVTVNFQQKTDYPSSGQVEILVNPSVSVEMELKLRIPKWCHNASVKINGKIAENSIKGGKFFAINRKWKNGDRVELEMPMTWRFIRGRKSQSGRVAVMRGPVLFCANPERQQKGQSQGETAGMEPVNTADINGERLRYLTIDPSALPQGPFNDNSIRPGGMACKIKAWRIENYMPIGPDMELVLTEFPDPGGQLTYFLVPDSSAETIVEDELWRKRGDIVN
jgi:hypothetical protein